MLRAMELKRLAARIPGNPVGKVADAAFVLKVAGESGLARPTRPDKLARMGLTYARWGKNPATAATLSAIRYPHETYVEDERGSLTFAEVEGRSNALARALRDEGG